MQYLYSTGDTYSFMNMETYEQVELDKSQMENEVKYTNEIINSSIGIDETNKINDYQGALRYGNLNTETLLERIKKDQELYKNISHHCFDTSIYVTHLNETENNFEPFINYQFKSFKHILYLSNDKYTFPLQIKRIKY